NFKEGLKPIFNFKWRYIKGALKVSIPTIPHYYSTYLLDSSDRLIMKTVGVATSENGVYNAAYTVGNFIRQAGMASGFAIGPMLNIAYKEGKEKRARDLVFILQIVFLVGSLTLCVWLKEIFQLLLRNRELQESYQLGLIIIMSYCYRPMYLGANSKLFYLEKTSLLLKVTFVAAVLNVGLNFILIPFWGVFAAAGVTYISLLYMGYAGFYLKTVRETNRINYYPVFWLTLTLIFTVLALICVEFDIIGKVVVSVATLLSGIFFIRRINKNLV